MFGYATDTTMLHPFTITMHVGLIYPMRELTVMLCAVIDHVRGEDEVKQITWDKTKYDAIDNIAIQDWIDHESSYLREVIYDDYKKSL